MTERDKALAVFQTRVRDLIHRYEELKAENQELYSMVEQNEQEIQRLQAKITQQEYDYQSLKMARMLEISGKDLQDAKDRIAKLVREVNKCIDVLSDER